MAQQSTLITIKQACGKTYPVMKVT